MHPADVAFFKGMSSFASCALRLLFLFSLISPIHSVCSICYGSGVGCPGDSARCPWVTDVATNVASIGAAAGGAIVIAKLLPSKICRLFPKNVLQTIASLAVKLSNSGTPFDPSGKTESDIVSAVRAGRFSKTDGIIELNTRISAATELLDVEKIRSFISILDLISENSLKDTSSMEGGFLYVLYTESVAFCSGKDGSAYFDFCMEADDDSKGSSKKSYAATLIRPHTEHAMYSLLNAFSMTCHALGLANILAMGPFLERVVYEQVRSSSVPWFVAFEVMIIYLRHVEDGSGKYNLVNVVHDLGGLDDVRAQGFAAARQFYPATFFRTHGGNPKVDLVLSPSGGKGDDDYEGDVKGSLSSAKQGCAAWNLSRKHKKKHIDLSAQLCKFLHKCDQFVDDKGKGGQCLGDHKRPDCTYDPAHKVSKPLK